MYSYATMKQIDIREHIKTACTYLNIEFRGRAEVIPALEWFVIMMTFVLVISTVQRELSSLFQMAYESGHYTFSLALVNWGMQTSDFATLFFSAYAFTYLATGTIRLKEETE